MLHNPDQDNGEGSTDPRWGKKKELFTADIYEWKVEFLSKITPKMVGRFCQISFDTKTLNRKYRDVLLIHDSEEIQ